MKLANVLPGAGVLLALVLGTLGFAAPVSAQDLSAPQPTVLIIDNGQGDLPTRALAVQSPDDFVRSHPMTIDEFNAQYFPTDPARGRQEFDRLRGQTRGVCQDAVGMVRESYTLIGLFRGNADEFADLRAEIPGLVDQQRRSTWGRRGSLVVGAVINPFSIPGSVGYELDASASDQAQLFNLDVTDANIGLTQNVIRAQLLTQRANLWWLRIAHPYCVASYGIEGAPAQLPSYDDLRWDDQADRGDDRRDRADRDDRRDRYDRRDRRDERRRWPSGRRRD